MFPAAKGLDAVEAERRKKADKLEQRILNLGQMRADGELTKEQYQKLYAQSSQELEALQKENRKQLDYQATSIGFDLDKIKKACLKW